MATQKQIDANQGNAQKSRGPITQAGKDVSRFNALTHGLSAQLPEAFEVDRQEFDADKARWHNELKPKGNLQFEWVETMAVENIRVKRARTLFYASIRNHAERAYDMWDSDRRNQVEEIATGLTKNPSRTISRLEKLPQGCDWLINRWEQLEICLRDNQTLTADRDSMMSDLLGIDPRVRDVIDDTSHVINVDEYLDIIKLKLEYLNKQREYAERHDNRDREMAETGMGVEMTPDGLRLDRYERMAQARFSRAYKLLINAKHADVQESAPVKTEQSSTNAINPVKQYAKLTAEVAMLAEAAELCEVEVTSPEPLRPVAEPIKPRHGLNRQQRRKQAAMERRASA